MDVVDRATIGMNKESDVASRIGIVAMIETASSFLWIYPTYSLQNSAGWMLGLKKSQHPARSLVQVISLYIREDWFL